MGGGSQTTHAIYRSGKVDWKAKRLAAQLKVAVEQMDSLVVAYEDSTKAIVEYEWPEMAVRQEVVSLLAGLAARGDLPEEVVPKDWSRFAENFSKLVCSSHSAPRNNKDELVVNAVRRFESEVIAVGPGNVPRSLLLIQYDSGVLARDGVLFPPLYQFPPSLPTI